MNWDKYFLVILGNLQTKCLTKMFLFQFDHFLEYALKSLFYLIYNKKNSN